MSKEKIKHHQRSNHDQVGAPQLNHGKLMSMRAYHWSGSKEELAKNEALLIKSSKEENKKLWRPYHSVMTEWGTLHLVFYGKCKRKQLPTFNKSNKRGNTIY